MTKAPATGTQLSTFAGELLARIHGNLMREMGNGAGGAFGRVVQEAVELAMQVMDPGLRRNPGAGIPDCWCILGAQRCACEIKYTDSAEVPLGIRDVQGMHLAGDAEGSRLIVVDVQFPARLWVIDAQHLVPGGFRPSGHAHLHQTEESGLLAVELERLLRLADTRLIGTEAEAKALLREVAGMTTQASVAP